MSIRVMCHHCGRTVNVADAIFCPRRLVACQLAHLPDLRLVA